MTHALSFFHRIFSKADKSSTQAQVIGDGIAVPRSLARQAKPAQQIRNPYGSAKVVSKMPRFQPARKRLYGERAQTPSNLM